MCWTPPVSAAAQRQGVISYHIISSQICWWNKKMKMCLVKCLLTALKLATTAHLRELKQFKGTILHIHISLALSLKCHPFGPVEIPVREATANKETWVGNFGKLTCWLSHYCLCLLEENTAASAEVSISTGKATGKGYSALVNTTLPLKSVF